MNPAVQNRKIVFFDGVCNLCNRSVDFLIRRDRNRVLHFAPLQGITSKKLIDPEQLIRTDSFFYWRNGELLSKSTAAIYVLSELGFWWKWVKVFLIVPPFIRNSVYEYVARNRYKWYGKKSSCRLPSEEERTFFLD
jgi:predicted DCC family thiol-disulfide oxidoreductase YuxK